MFEGFKHGFYNTSYKRREIRKPLLINLLTHNPNLFLLNNLEQKKKNRSNQKTTHTEIPTLGEQSIKQMKSALHQEVSEFNPSGQLDENGSAHQSNPKPLGRLQDQRQQIESIMQSQRSQQNSLEQISSYKMRFRRILNKRKQLNQNLRFRNYVATVKVNSTFGRILTNIEKSRRDIGRSNQNYKQVKGKTRSGTTKKGPFSDGRRSQNNQIWKTQFKLIIEEGELGMQDSRVLGFVKNQVQTSKLLLSGDQLDTTDIFISLTQKNKKCEHYLIILI